MMTCNIEFAVGFAFGACVAGGALIMLAIVVCLAIKARPRLTITEHKPEG